MRSANNAPRGTRHDMNRNIRLVGVAILVLFVGLFVQLNYLQVVHASSLDHNKLNTHSVVQEYTKKRGAIETADGTLLAQSVPSNNTYKYLRQYPQGPLFGEITGYFSYTYGTDGLERTYDRVLTGASASFRFPTNTKQLKQLLVNRDPSQSLHLTVLDKLQKLAAAQLGGRLGAVVAIDPKTGGILAMYSNPTFDPNKLSSQNQQAVTAYWNQLVHAAGSPLASPSYRQRFFPGSTFKIVTASAVYDHDPSLATKSYPVLTGLPLPDTNGQVLHNFAGESCGGKLLELFTVSCNSGFGQVGLDLWGNTLASQAKAFGFDSVPPIDLPGAAQSFFPSGASLIKDPPSLAKSAIGQESVQATPLQMAMAAAAIADGGTIMTPHLLSYVTDSQGDVVQRYEPKVWLHATSASTASSMTGLMISVVQKGTGVAAQIPGIQVAGKTGTAQTGGPDIETWFAAFAPANDPQIAVAALVENQPPGTEYQGGTIAAPIAKAVIQAYLSK